MNRRHFLSGTALAVVGGGAVWLNSPTGQRPLTMDAAIDLLDQMATNRPVTRGEWNLSQILIHCAQSVEYSMDGFPEHKSDLFKHTVGSLAFSAFSAKGEMTHGLSEAIPGAPAIDRGEDVSAAWQRFRDSMVRFKNHQGSLAPHFAYGALSKVEYEQAHAMHFYNHLQEMTFS